jgi:hypothetical protein
LKILLDLFDLFELTLQVDPLRYPAKVEMVNINEWHQREASGRLIIRWNRFDLSWAESDLVDVDLWGYYEDDQGPHWDYLQVN